MHSFSYLEPVCCSTSSSNCFFLTCIQVSQEAGQVVWYSHLFQNFPQFIVIHTVKGFGIVNKAEIDVFLELSCFFHDPTDVGNLIPGCNAHKDFIDALTFLMSVKRRHLLDFFFITKIGEFQGEQDFSICCNSNCASLVAQRLNHLPAMRETWDQSLGREDLLEKEMATHSSVLA